MKDPSLPKEILRSAQNKNASGIRLRVNRLSWKRTEKERAGQNARLDQSDRGYCCWVAGAA